MTTNTSPKHADEDGVDAGLRKILWEHYEEQLPICDGLQSISHWSDDPVDREFSHLLEFEDASVEVLFRHSHVQVTESTTDSLIVIPYSRQQCFAEISSAIDRLLIGARHKGEG